MRSNYHKAAITLIKTIYPTLAIQEEVPLKIGNQTLYLDIYLPLLKLAIEVHGEQHYQENSYFYKSKADFYKAQKRDKDKEDFLKEQGITLIILKYNEQDKWKDQIIR